MGRVNKCDLHVGVVSYLKAAHIPCGCRQLPSGSDNPLIQSKIAVNLNLVMGSALWDCLLVFVIFWKKD